MARAQTSEEGTAVNRPVLRASLLFAFAFAMISAVIWWFG